MAKNRTRRFDWISGILASCAGLAVSASAHAQVTFNEVEPNDNKAGAQVIAGMAPGDNIAGNSTGTSTTVAGAASSDNFRITTTAAAVPGVYRYRLVITTAGTTGHAGSIRGLTQTAGVPNAGTDSAVQTSSTATTPARFVQWYANGNPSEIFFRVTGGAATTGNYAATLERTLVTPIAGPSTVIGGNVTISSIGQTSADTDFWVYDSNFNPIAGFGCDDETVAGGGPGTTAQSIATRTLTPGTYFVAITNFNLANNQGSPADDDFRTGTVTDFANALANSSTTTNVDCDFTITGGDLVTSIVTALKPAAFDIAIAQFTVVPPSSPTNPSGTATATPANVVNDGTGTSTIAVTVIPGQSPASTAHTVTITDANLVGSPIALLDNGIAPDAAAGDNIFTRSVTVVNGTATGTLPLTAAIQETAPLARSGSANVNLNIILPPPTNDLCANAITITAGTPAVTGDNSQATTAGDPTPTCQTSSSKGLWYDFTNGPAAASFVIDTEGSTQGDTIVTVFDACGGTQIACDDDGGTGLLSTLLVALAPNQNVKIMVSSFGAAAAGGGFNLNIVSATSGACCNDTTGACTLVITGICPAGATYQGDGSVCTPSPCPASGACCNDTTGACAVTVQTACASGSTWQGAATVCTPNPCPQPPPPANDECAAATSLTVGAAPIPGSNVNSTQSVLAACTGSTLDVWYSFNAPAAGVFQATVDSDTGNLYSIAAYTACGTTEFACTAALVDPAVLNINVTTPGIHFIRVASFSPANTFVVSVAGVTSGACCNDTTGACTVVVGACPVGATYQGDNTVCTPSPCPASGACCNDLNGVCSITVQTACASGSTWQGAATVCTPNPCPQPPPPANDDCANAIALSLNVQFNGDNTTATGDGTEGPGGACYTTSPTSFRKAVWFTFTAPASDVFGITACGSSFDTVLSIYSGTCVAFGGELGCDDDFCDGVTPPGSGLASEIAPVALTAGQTFLIRLSVWGPSASNGGAYNITVTGTAPAGVCCRGSTCNTSIAAAACTTSGTQFGASFNTGATACSTTSATAPCCHADYDKTGGIQVADIFAFLNDWFASNTFADFGGDGTGITPDVNDIFSFLNAWFAGGC